MTILIAVFGASLLFLDCFPSTSISVGLSVTPSVAEG